MRPVDGIIDAVMEELGPDYMPVGFDVTGTLFGSVSGETSYWRNGYPDFTLETFCDGYIFQKPFREYEGVTPIKGWYKWRNSRKVFSEFSRVKKFPWVLRLLPKKWVLSLGAAQETDIPGRFQHLR